MIAPSERLLWLSVGTLLPLFSLAGFVPAVSVPCILLGVLVGIAMVSDAWRGTGRGRRVAVTAIETETKWFKGRRETVRLQIARARGICQAALDCPSGIAAQQPVPVKDGAASIECMPQARGRYAISRCFLRIGSPWNLWCVSVAKPVELSIRVFPDLKDEPGAALLFKQKQLGIRQQRPVGKGREFERLRDYAPGDSFDEIYWKATARRGFPVVRVFQIERTQDIYVVLDTSLRSGGGDRLDRFVRAALMVALATEQEGDNFGLVTFDRQVTRFVPAGRGRQHFSHCRDAIFDIQSAPVPPDFDEVFTFLQLRVRRRAMLLFVTDLEDPIAAEAFLSGARLLTGKHVVAVASIEDPQARRLFEGEIPESVPGIHNRLAGHLKWVALREIRTKLQQIGIGMRSLRAETVGMDLVSEYADIKRRQVL